MDNTTPPELNETQPIQNKIADASVWLKFILIASLAIGTGLLLAGIIFFFAFNWQAIPPFAKLGMVAALMIALCVAIIKVKMRNSVKNASMFAMCVLVGVFLAIFGQVYQIQADMPSFFLTWALCIVVWVYIADFYPLWIFLYILVTCGMEWHLFEIVFYHSVPYHSVSMLYNVVWILFFLYSPKFLPWRSEAPTWVINTLATIVFAEAIYSICWMILDGDGWNDIFVALGVMVATGYLSIKQKNTYLYSLLFLGGICILQSFFIEIASSELLTLFSFFTMAAVGGSAYAIVRKHQQWKNEQNK